MSYKYSKGHQIIGDLSGSDDANRNTGIDFEEDYIGFEAGGSTVMVVSGSKVGIGTTTPDYELDVAGNIGIDQYIYHNGDSDTNLNFRDNRITLTAGSLSMIDIEKKGSAPHEITMNNGGNNVDFVVKGNGSGEGNPAFKVDASTNRVGINGVGSPDEALHVDGNIKLQGDDPRIKINGDTDSHPGLELYENGTRKWIVYNDYTNDNLTFKTNSAVRMSIEQDGNVGIGTTSPDQLLHIQDGNAILQHNNNNGFSTEIQFTKSRHATDGSHTVVQDGDILGEISFKGSDGDEFVTAAAINAQIDGSPGNNDMPGKIVFSTTQDGAVSLTTAMTIGNTQNCIVERALVAKGTMDGYMGTAQFGAFDYSITGCRIISNGADDNTKGTFTVVTQARDNSPSNNAMLIANNNNTTFLGSVTENSDSKLKTDIRGLDSMLPIIENLRPVKYKRIAQPTDDDKTTADYYGFIAQEVSPVLPDLVHSNQDTNFDGSPTGTLTLSISYTEMIPILTKAIQEQQEQIDELKAQVAALQN